MLGDGPRVGSAQGAFKLRTPGLNSVICYWPDTKLPITDHYTHIYHNSTPSPPIAPPHPTHRHNHITTTAAMAQEDAGKRLEEAKKLSKDQPSKAEAIYNEILSQPPGTTDKAVREYESALLGLGELYRDHQRTQDLANLIEKTREVSTQFARAKTSKLSE